MLHLVSQRGKIQYLRYEFVNFNLLSKFQNIEIDSASIIYVFYNSRMLQAEVLFNLRQLIEDESTVWMKSYIIKSSNIITVFIVISLRSSKHVEG